MICPSCDHDNIAGADLCENCGMDLAGLDVPTWGVDRDDPFLAKPLSSLELKPALLLGPSATVCDAVALMRDEGEGCVFVQDEDGRLLGVVTEHDLCNRVANPGRDPVKTRLEEVMTPRPVQMETGDPLAWALHRMGVDGHRHLPVVRDGKLEGFLSARSVLDVLLDAGRQQR